MARLLLEAGRPLEAREALEDGGSAPGRILWMQKPRWASRTTSRAMPVAPAPCGSRCLARRPENARVEAYLAMLVTGGSVKTALSIDGLVPLTCVAGCGKAGRSRAAGDQSYGEGRYAQALAEYRQALEKDPDARVWAKAGAAALRTGNLDVASDAYLRLAAEDPTRAEEAAEGLESVARAAERAGDGRRLQAAVVGMGAIAPDRSTGRYALDLIRRPGAEATDLVGVLPGAIAVAPDPETVDSLLRRVWHSSARDQWLWRGASSLPGGSPAAPRWPHLRSRAEEGVAACSLSLGLRSEATGNAGGRGPVVCGGNSY